MMRYMRPGLKISERRRRVQRVAPMDIPKNKRLIASVAKGLLFPEISGMHQFALGVVSGTSVGKPRYRKASRNPRKR